MKKHLPKILSILSILIFIFAISIMVIGTIAIRQNKPLYIFNRAITAIPTPSMEGDLEDSLLVGDLAIIKPGSYDQIEVGDIIVFQRTQNNLQFLIIHRVIEITPDGLVTKGDANSTADQGFVTEETYQGVYISKITWLRPVTNMITSGTGRTLIFGLIIVILVGLILTEGLHILKTLMKAQQEAIEEKHNEQLDRLKAEEREKLLKELQEKEKP